MNDERVGADCGKNVNPDRRTVLKRGTATLAGAALMTHAGLAGAAEKPSPIPTTEAAAPDAKK
jgi:hypothetical protein